MNKTEEPEMEYKREPASIVEDVVLIGMPRLLESKEWVACREVVGGRLVNCYNTDDWFLSYLFQIRCWAGMSRWMNGTHPVLDVAGVENFDISEFVSTHGRYPLAVPQILHKVGLGQPDVAMAENKDCAVDVSAEEEEEDRQGDKANVLEENDSGASIGADAIADPADTDADVVARTA